MTDLPLISSDGPARYGFDLMTGFGSASVTYPKQDETTATGSSRFLMGGARLHYMGSSTPVALGAEIDFQGGSGSLYGPNSTALAEIQLKHILAGLTLSVGPWKFHEKAEGRVNFKFGYGVGKGEYQITSAGKTVVGSRCPPLIDAITGEGQGDEILNCHKKDVTGIYSLTRYGVEVEVRSGNILVSGLFAYHTMNPESPFMLPSSLFLVGLQLGVVFR